MFLKYLIIVTLPKIIYVMRKGLKNEYEKEIRGL